MARLMDDATGTAAPIDVTDRPLDLVHLARQTLGNKDLEQEVLALFLRQSVLLAKQLDEARDAQSFRIAAHTLKGSAQGIGAWRVAKAAQSLESLSSERDGPAARAARAGLDAAVAEANATIRGLIAA